MNLRLMLVVRATFDKCSKRVCVCVFVQIEALRVICVLATITAQNKCRLFHFWLPLMFAQAFCSLLIRLTHFL